MRVCVRACEREREAKKDKGQREPIELLGEVLPTPPPPKINVLRLHCYNNSSLEKKYEGFVNKVSTGVGSSSSGRGSRVS